MMQKIKTAVFSVFAKHTKSKFRVYKKYFNKNFII